MILLLGATGKVGRLVRGAWDRATGSDARLVPVGRSGEGVTHWEPGEPTDALPRVDAVAALWGVTPGQGRDLSENARLALAAQHLGTALGARLVLHASSAAIYRPGAADLPETQPPDPPAAYGAAKAEMERVLEHAPGPRAICLRIGNVAGADSLCAAVDRGDTVTLDRFADGGSPVRSYIGPSDLARVIVALSAAETRSLPAILNVAAPSPTAMADLALAAGRPVAFRAAPPTAVPRVALDTTRLARICPLDPEAGSAARLIADWRSAAAECPA
ncbi:NAD-dependent epimerase/dehydratase family protein [Roseivivax jejudonensis]|uniref:NAD-dependent epimerase/dehydratase family protein n=1 Tax=Roseivivax jejudonensis TaxID=1529041 RepID=UPI000A267632|nr:NAD-dependent epimerase/dehydratase family protein [Roseivivax jejudonensis]